MSQHNFFLLQISIISHCVSNFYAQSVVCDHALDTILEPIHNQVARVYTSAGVVCDHALDTILEPIHNRPHAFVDDVTVVCDHALDTILEPIHNVHVQRTWIGGLFVTML